MKRISSLIMASLLTCHFSCHPAVAGTDADQPVQAEAEDVSNAIRGLDQSYYKSGIRGHIKKNGEYSAWTAGSSFIDTRHRDSLPGLKGPVPEDISIDELSGRSHLHQGKIPCINCPPDFDGPLLNPQHQQGYPEHYQQRFEQRPFEQGYAPQYEQQFQSQYQPQYQPQRYIPVIGSRPAPAAAEMWGGGRNYYPGSHKSCRSGIKGTYGQAWQNTAPAPCLSCVPGQSDVLSPPAPVATERLEPLPEIAPIPEPEARIRSREVIPYGQPQVQIGPRFPYPPQQGFGPLQVW